ncbi:MAG: HEPN domain-containing protein [Canidatus Methanoxibalbensis ujae]|nr:HEPN domain-containing protein [Candidatus Methanoxibalbensis ujae]
MSLLSSSAISRESAEILPLFSWIHLITHSLKELVRECKKLEKGFSEIESYARHLDMFYIPTQYPNSLAGDLAPAEFYEREDAEKCINCAELILESVKKFSKK